MSGSASADRIRVVVSDDHPVVRQGLRSFLEAQGFAVVGEAADGAAAVRLVAETRPDVLLTDLVMPGMDGIEAIRRVRGLGIPVGILVLTSFSGAEQVIPAIRAGADGYLLKDAGPAALTDAIRAVHRGEALLSPEAAAVVMARVAGDDGTGSRARHRPPSPPRPRPPDPPGARCWRAWGGACPTQLAAELFVSEKTVKTHVSSLLAKLRLADRPGGGSGRWGAAVRPARRGGAAPARHGVYLLAVRTSGQRWAWPWTAGPSRWWVPRPRASRWWPPCWRWAGRWPWGVVGRRGPGGAPRPPGRGAQAWWWTGAGGSGTGPTPAQHLPQRALQAVVAVGPVAGGGRRGRRRRRRRWRGGAPPRGRGPGLAAAARRAWCAVAWPGGTSASMPQAVRRRA